LLILVDQPVQYLSPLQADLIEIVRHRYGRRLRWSPISGPMQMMTSFSSTGVGARSRPGPTRGQGSPRAGGAVQPRDRAYTIGVTVLYLAHLLIVLFARLIFDHSWSLRSQLNHALGLSDYVLLSWQARWPSSGAPWARRWRTTPWCGHRPTVIDRTSASNAKAVATVATMYRPSVSRNIFLRPNRSVSWPNSQGPTHAPAT